MANGCNDINSKVHFYAGPEGAFSAPPSPSQGRVKNKLLLFVPIHIHALIFCVMYSHFRLNQDSLGVDNAARLSNVFLFPYVGFYSRQVITI